MKRVTCGICGRHDHKSCMDEEWNEERLELRRHWAVVAERRGNKSHNQMMMYRKRLHVTLAEVGEGSRAADLGVNDLRRIADAKFNFEEMRRNRRTARKSARQDRRTYLWCGMFGAFWTRVEGENKMVVACCKCGRWTECTYVKEGDAIHDDLMHDEWAPYCGECE